MSSDPPCTSSLQGLLVQPPTIPHGASTFQSSDSPGWGEYHEPLEIRKSCKMEQPHPMEIFLTHTLSISKCFIVQV